MLLSNETRFDANFIELQEINVLCVLLVGPFEVIA